MGDGLPVQGSCEGAIVMGASPQQQPGVQVFGEMDPDLDDDYGEDELLAEGHPDFDSGSKKGWGGMSEQQMRHNNRGGSY